jgi:NADH dehydrogenase FAD-containing subunit
MMSLSLAFSTPPKQPSTTLQRKTTTHQPTQTTGKPFEFLSLGIMAYVGNEKALVSAEVLDGRLDIAGAFAFLLWRSVYITKQVSTRNRVLILFDWLKTRLFGRDLSQF